MIEKQLFVTGFLGFTFLFESEFKYDEGGGIILYVRETHRENDDRMCGEGFFHKKITAFRWSFFKCFLVLFKNPLRR